MTDRLQVVKLGGSLLDWPEVVPALRSWIPGQSRAANVLIVGGGKLVDAVRQLDARRHVDVTTAHWLCIRAMSLTATIVAEWLGASEVVPSLDRLRRQPEGAFEVLDVEAFLRQDQGTRDRLPCSWDVTSDSIAARIATVVEAQELVLLKSALPPGPATREALAERGFVDRYFPRASKGMAVRVVNLRSPQFAELVLD